MINGELREWTGPLAEISSPICLREGGALRRPVIGSVPAMDEAAALAALEAAARAWDEGRGHWPTLTVSARIEAVEAFVVRMLAVRRSPATPSKVRRAPVGRRRRTPGGGA